MSRTTAWFAIAVCVVVFCSAATPASAAPALTQIQVLGPPGGWLTQPNGDGGIFNLYLYDQTGTTIQNPSGTINLPLANGTYIFKIKANDQATGPIFYLNLWFNGNFGPVDIAVSTASQVGSATVGGTTVKVTNFMWLNGGQPNQVGNDFPSPDGFLDSVGYFVLQVGPSLADPCAPAPATDFPNLVSWWRAEGNFQDSFDGNHGFPVGTVGFVPGRVGQAFNFNGSGAVAVSSSPSLNFGTGNFSGSFWVKTTAPTVGNFLVEKDIPGV